MSAAGERPKGTRPPGFRVVRWLARLVPAARRRDWLDEWYGELFHAHEAARERGESPARTRWRLRLRAGGALRDALCLRASREPSSAPHGGVALREGMRVLRRQPGFVLTVVCTLALGIGAGTAVFSVVDALVLRPLPYRGADRLVLLSEGSGSVFTRYENADYARVWRTHDEVFEAIHVFSDRPVTLTRPDEARRLQAHLLEPGVLGALGVSPVVGREFLPEESVPGRDGVVMLSHRQWRSGFGEDPGVVGTTVYLDDAPFTVVGVMPPSVRMLPGGVPDIALPLPDTLESPLVLLGRLRSDLTLAGAQRRMDAVAAALDSEQPREGGWGARLTPFDRPLSESTRRGLAVLSGAVTLLLLVSCVNAAGLLFVRGIARRPELAIRRATGATGGALFLQSLAESVVSAVLSGVTGVTLAWWGVRVLVALAPSWLIGFSHNPVAVDARVLTFALALTLATGLAFGLLPAMRALRTDSVAMGQSSSGASPEITRVRTVVHTLQLALAVMLLAGASVLGRSFLRLSAVDLGFDPHGVVILSYDLPEFRYRRESDRTAFNDELDARLRALPGVEAMSWSIYAVIGWMGIRPADGLETEGGAASSTPDEARGSGPAVVSGYVQSRTRLVPFGMVDSAYFRVMGVRLLEGRAFTAADADDDAGSVIVDVDLAHRLWPGEHATGRRFRLGADRPWLTVVGVAGDVKLEAPDDPYGPYVIFYPTSRDRMSHAAGVVLRTRDSDALAGTLRQVVRSLDPGLPVRIRTATELWGETIQLPRFLLLVMTVFAIVALLLAAIGMYGLVAFDVARRRREIGIRVAVGASPEQVVRGVLTHGMRIAVTGLVLGLAGAVALSRFLHALLFETSPLDPAALALVAAVLTLSSGAALIAPALRAAEVDPVEALRSE